MNRAVSKSDRFAPLADRSSRVPGRTPPPQVHLRTLWIGLLQGLKGGRFLMKEVPPVYERPLYMQVRANLVSKQ